MRRGIFLLLVLAGILTYCHNAHAIDGYAYAGIGMALNNNKPYREETKDECGYRGMLVDLGVVKKDAIGNLDAQLSWTYVACSIFGTEQTVALAFIGGERFTYGAGLILGYRQAYETWEKEYLGSDGYDPLHPADRRECMFCGITANFGYRWSRASVELRYWRTDFNIYPGHNGFLFVPAYRF